MIATEQQIAEWEGLTPILRNIANGCISQRAHEQLCTASKATPALIADLQEAQDTIYIKDCEYKQAEKLAAAYLIELQRARAKLAESEADNARLRSEWSSPSEVAEMESKLATMRMVLAETNNAAHALASRLCGLPEWMRHGTSMIDRESVMELVVAWRSKWDSAIAEQDKP